MLINNAKNKTKHETPKSQIQTDSGWSAENMVTVFSSPDRGRSGCSVTLKAKNV